MTQHVQNWNDSWPDWVPDPVRRYIAHTEAGTTIRSLARAGGCHASTVLRQIRQVENEREDPLVDEALRWLGQRTRSVKPACAEDEPALPGFRAEEGGDPLPNIEKEAVPALRRLSHPGAVLAVAAEMDRAVIVRNGEGGETHRLGVVERRVAQALALNHWIACDSAGRLSRYRITALGHTVLNNLIAKADNRASGFSERPAAFIGQSSPRDPIPKPRHGQVETPIMSLARRRDTEGRPFLTPALIRAAERIQDDFELAQMEPRTTTNWDDFLTAGVSSGGGEGDTLLRGAAAARARVSAALRVLGPGLGDVVLECCCRLQGLETAEKKLGWSARSGKIVLRIALQRLQQHYDGLNDGGGLIG